MGNARHIPKVTIGSAYNPDATACRVYGGMVHSDGVYSAPAGSVSAPAIHFGDATTGIYRSGSNQVSVAVSGVQRALIDSTGVTVTGYVRAAGVDAWAAVVADATSNTANQGPVLQFVRARNGGAGARAATQNGDSLGEFTAAPYISGTAQATAAAISFAQDGAIGTRAPGRIMFRTAGASSGGLATALTVWSDQKVQVHAAFQHSGSLWGILGATPRGKYTITGSRGGNAAVASIIAALVAFGHAIDGTTA